jgi:hypothetical protein
MSAVVSLAPQVTVLLILGAAVELGAYLLVVVVPVAGALFCIAVSIVPSIDPKRMT